MRALANTFIVMGYLLMSLGVSISLYANREASGIGIDRDLNGYERVGLVVLSVGWPVILGIELAERNR